MGQGSPFILTKIIATVGPACARPEQLHKLIEEGVRVFRLNFSHGTFEQFAASLSAIRQAEAMAGQPIGVLGDLSGPKIRIGKVIDGGVPLEVGERVEFVRRPIVAGSVEAAHPDDPSDLRRFSTTYPQLVDDVSPGQRLLINDGAIRLLVVEKTGSGEDQRLVATPTNAGLVTSGKGINLPDTAVSAPSLTEHDHACARWAMEHGVDFLALSFVRSAADVRQLKALLRTLRREGATPPPVVAKIEKPQALTDLNGIVEASDGIMVARGDLGVEMDLAEVPVIQKRIIGLAHDHGKPVIVATQMLQSMIEEPSPTRAEASDVANAIFDGADAVMLSGETAVGKYPAVAVSTMRRIAAAAEVHMRTTNNHFNRPPRKLQDSRYRTAAVAHGVSVIVGDLDAKLVVAWSELGGGARYLSQNRLPVPILAASSNGEALRRMGLLFGVVPLSMDRPGQNDPNRWLNDIDALLLRRGWAQEGDPVVVVKGEPLGNPGVTNAIRVHYVGDVCRVEWNT